MARELSFSCWVCCCQRPLESPKATSEKLRTCNGDRTHENSQDVAVILKLHPLGWGKKAIARELGISKNTVRRCLQAGGVSGGVFRGCPLRAFQEEGAAVNPAYAAACTRTPPLSTAVSE